jgi:hypothetical protein
MLRGGAGFQRNVGGELEGRTGLELVDSVEDKAAKEPFGRNKMFGFGNSRLMDEG